MAEHLRNQIARMIHDRRLSDRYPPSPPDPGVDLGDIALASEVLELIRPKVRGLRDELDMPWDDPEARGAWNEALEAVDALLAWSEVAG